MAAEPPWAFASAAALMVLDEGLRIVGWNDKAEALIGIPPVEAIGKACWDVVAGRDEDGSTICHPGCAKARMLREGRFPPVKAVQARTANGRRPIAIETVVMRTEGGSVSLHVMRDAPATRDEQPPGIGPAPALTPRQLEIVVHLAAGRPAKVIATGLGLREATVRNHIRLALRALGAHSQLEAVAVARSHRLL